jgi:Zn-dependent protease with chaperone function
MINRRVTRREAIAITGGAVFALLPAAGCERKPISGNLGQPAESEGSDQGVVHKYDIMTDLDVLFSRYLGLATVGEIVSDWPLVKEVVGFCKELVDAGVIADHLNEALPVDKQPAFAPVKKIVDECAVLLHVPAPHLLVRSDPRIDAYVTRLGEPHLLVLTSGLYEAYKGQPQELRFVIGHELGHLKCGHIRCHAVARHLVKAVVQSTNYFGLAGNVVAPVLVGQLMRWYRESELGADRAGLVCLKGDLKSAQRSLLRLLHGTQEADIDPNIAVQEQVDLENQPFVKVARYLKSFGGDHPFVPERLQALSQWSLTGSYAALVDRLKTAEAGAPVALQPAKRTLYIEAIEIKGLPDYPAYGVTRTPEPIIKAVYGDEWKQSGGLGKSKDPSLAELGWEFPYIENGRLIVEVSDRRRVDSDVLIGAAVTALPADSRNVQCDLRMDIKERIMVAQAPRATIKYHVVS